MEFTEYNVQHGLRPSLVSIIILFDVKIEMVYSQNKP